MEGRGYPRRVSRYEADGPALLVLLLAGVLFWVIRRLWTGSRIRRLLLPPVSIRTLGGSSTAVAGRILPIVEIVAPVSGRRCVAYQDVVESHEASRLGDRIFNNPYHLDQGTWRKMSGNVIGAFVVADDSGKALVWPAGASLIIDESWSRREDRLALRDSCDGRRESEKIIRSGEAAYIRGTPHTFDALMARLRQDCGVMPGELLQALLNQGDLKNLPCFFADGNPFVVANQTFEKLSSDLIPDVFEG